MKAGVYQIRNIVNGWIYIGMSRDIEKRWKMHLRDLKSRKHCNHLLQKDWNEYGTDCFEFTVLEYMRKNARIGAAENKWMLRKLTHANLYNVEKKDDLLMIMNSEDVIAKSVVRKYLDGYQQQKAQVIA